MQPRLEESRGWTDLRHSFKSSATRIRVACPAPPFSHPVAIADRREYRVVGFLAMVGQQVSDTAGPGAVRIASQARDVSMIWTAWNNGAHHSSGAAYGFKIATGVGHAAAVRRASFIGLKRRFSSS